MSSIDAGSGVDAGERGDIDPVPPPAPVGSSRPSGGRGTNGSAGPVVCSTNGLVGGIAAIVFEGVAGTEDAPGGSSGGIPANGIPGFAGAVLDGGAGPAGGFEWPCAGGVGPGAGV